MNYPPILATAGGDQQSPPIQVSSSFMQSPQTSIIGEITRCRISHPKQSSIDSIDCLDDYSLLLIFSKLSFVEKIAAQEVCQRWKHLIVKSIRCQSSVGVTISFAVCQDLRHQVTHNGCVGDLFNSAVEANTKWYFVNAFSLSSILSKCPILKSLILQNCIFCREVLEVFSSYCSPKLEHLDLSHSSCNINEIVQIISEKCCQTLRHVMLEENEINESGLRCLIGSCKKLEVLILDDNVQITGDCFDLLGDDISYLSIIGCNSITESGVSALISGNGKGVTHLRIGDSIAPSMFHKICQGMNSLKILEFNGFKADSNNASTAYTFISSLRTLQELVLKVPRITFDTQLMAIARNCNDLKVVKIDGAIVTDLGLSHLAIHCHLIEQIALIPCAETLTNRSITDECRLALTNLRHLRSLSLCGSSVTDAFVETISSSSRLSFIELDDCKALTKKSLELFIASAKSRPAVKIMVFIQRTNIKKNLLAIPHNLTVF